MRMKRRIDIIWIAAALLAGGAGGFALATASSSASDDSGAPAGTLQIAAAVDPVLASTDPGDSDAAAKLVYATGVAANDATAAPQTWAVGDRSVLGYMAADGRFCFAFRSLAGGCLQPGV